MPLPAVLLALLAQQPLAFTHVTVIDGADSLPRRNQTVVVRGNRIAAVGPASSTAIPSDSRVIPANDRFLIPGLWDMHVHTVVPGGRALLALYLANGVTGVRDMGGDWDSLRTWRGAITRGTLAGPRIIASGPYLEGGEVPIAHLLARNPVEARASVDSLVALGVDFVKVHSQLTREAYFAIARRARERGIPFAGHVPRVVGALAASDSGQRSIEHLLAIPLPCTAAESLALAPRFPVQRALGTCSTEDLAPFYQRLRRNRTWVTPTFTAQLEVATWPGRALPGDTLASYLPDALRRYVAEIFPMPDSIPLGADSVGLAIFAKRLAQVAAMQRAGVGVLSGTDAPLRNSPPGFGLHEELGLLVRGGMSPFQALRTATLEPARYLGLLDSAGTIAAGKVADLVLLDADPLRDIRNTRRIVAVVANGRWYGIKELLPLAGHSAEALQRFDIVITGGRVLDGTGNPWFVADLGIRGDRIAAIGNLKGATAAKLIDARGKYVAPGFIALHEHIDRGILRGQPAPNYLLQGFTTAVINADGLEGGIWPLAKQRDSLRKLGHALNLVPMVAHGTVRRLVMGSQPEEVMRPATPEELTRMQTLVRQGMEQGGFGLSTGLEYNPMRYSTTEELVALAKVVAEYGGHLQAHMRSQGRYPKWQLPSHMDHPTQRQVDWMDAIHEGIEIARRTGVPFWFDHIHAKGPREWGVSKPTVEAIQRAWDEGLQIYTNMHSWEGYAETVTLVPRWALAKQEVPGMSMSDDFPPVDYSGALENMERNLRDPKHRAMLESDALYEVDRQGGTDGLVILDFPDKKLVGKSLGQVARQKGLSVFDTILWLARNGFPDRLGGVVWS
ncbi:MAG TPA: amidohydrolase family protein, partial [Gemmatimonadales bacterium]|nr:amidohydrolase family protein [Gemmatimonadales bacterium]